MEPPDTLKAALASHSDEKTLLDRTRSLFELMRAFVRRRWNRALPFGDYFVDRWEKARYLGFGEGASIYDSALVLGDVTVGEGTWVGPNVVLDGSGGLTIGAWCSISAGVQIYSHESVRWALSGGTAPYGHKPTRIGSRCYLGPYVVVAMGVTIGDGSVIGAGSVVMQDIPAGSKAHGTPCAVVGKTEADAK